MDSDRNSPGTGKVAGYLLDYLSGYHQETVWRGIAAGLGAFGCSMVTFVGQPFDHGRADNIDVKATNRIYELATPPWISGYFYHGETLGFDISPEQFGRWIAPFRVKPCISIGPSHDDTPAVTVEGRTGVEGMVAHLVEHHGRRNIAFVGGIEASVEARERLAAYQAGLRTAGIPYRPEYTFVGDFWLTGGQNAVRAFLDERHLKIDGLMAANDYMSLGALRELRSRGIRVPQDVSVAGFDDILDAEHEHPALSSIRWPLAEQAARAVELMNTMLAGGRRLDTSPLGTAIVLRRSCGCQSTSMELADQPGRLSPKEALGQLPTFAGTSDRVIQNLVEGCQAALGSGSLAVFQETAETAIYDGLHRGDQPESWQDLLSLTRIALLPAISDSAKALDFENLINKLRIFVGVMEAKRLKLELSKASLLVERLGTAMKDVSGATNLETLGTLLRDKLKDLELASFYLALREDIAPGNGPRLGSDAKFRLYAAMCDRKDLLENRQSGSYPARDLLPQTLLPTRLFNLIVMPVNFGNNFYGIAVYEQGPSDLGTYTRISDQIGTTVHEILLSLAEKSREAAMLAENARIISQARPITQSVVEVSKIASEEAAAVESTGDAARKMRQDIMETQAEIRRMAEGVSKIRGYTAVIEDISETINLLGLNAAIEAARAGQLGRGFNVIATEIRKLSESARSNAQNISAALQDLEAEADRSVASVARSSEAFTNLDSELSQMLAALQLIASKMSTLAGSSQTLIDSLHQSEG